MVMMFIIFMGIAYNLSSHIVVMAILHLLVDDNLHCVVVILVTGSGRGRKK